MTGVHFSEGWRLITRILYVSLIDLNYYSTKLGAERFQDILVFLVDFLIERDALQHVGMKELRATQPNNIDPVGTGRKATELHVRN